MEEAECVDIAGGAVCQCKLEGKSGDGMKPNGCQYPSCPKGMDRKEDFNGCYRYLPISIKANFTQATMICQKKGDEIVSIQNAKELDYLKEFALPSGHHFIWIGYTDSIFEGYFQWTDGSAGNLRFAGLDLKTNAPEKDCVMMEVATGKLSIVSCDDGEIGIVCKSPLYETKCAKGWELIEGKCYTLQKQKTTFYDAYLTCSLNGGDLLSVESESELKLVNEKLNVRSDKSVWIGYQYNYMQSGFGWTDRSVISYTPSKVAPAGSKCYAMLSGKWVPQVCSGSYLADGYICEKIPGVSKVCPKDSFRFGDKCLKVKQERDSALDARQTCKELGGQLVTLDSMLKHQLAVHFIKTKEVEGDYWIGLFERGAEKDYRWVDGTKLGKYFRWALDQPDDKDSAFNCVRMKKSEGYKWDDLNCEMNLPYLCEFYNSPCREDATCHSKGECFKGQCRCKSGFEGDGKDRCVDINECEREPCGDDATCTNSEGDFKCDCNKGFDGNGYICINILTCNVSKPFEKCHRNGICNPETSLCECKTGYQGNGIVCKDIDECLSRKLNGCDLNAKCTNSLGSFSCKCYEGFEGDGFKCEGTPSSCEDILRENPKAKNGKYIIDPDSNAEGGVKQFKVICRFYGDYAVTIVPNEVHRGYVKKVAGSFAYNKKVAYEAVDHKNHKYKQLELLVQRSKYCYQNITFICKKASLVKTTKYADANNTEHIINRCPCGDINTCYKEKVKCNCDGSGGSKKVDVMTITKEDATLPITKLSTGDMASGELWYKVSALACSSRPIDIPRDCHEAKSYYKLKQNRTLRIDPDGPLGPISPFLVHCDVTTYKDMGITELPAKGPYGVRSPSKIGSIPIKYPVGIKKLSGLIGISGFCSQEMFYYCKNSGLLAAGSSWTGASSKVAQTYWPSALGDKGSCACGSIKACADPTKQCDCDIADNVTRTDFGFIVEKSQLPIVSLNLQEVGEGKTSDYMVKRFRCGPEQFGIPGSCQDYRYMGYKQSYTYLIDTDGPRKTKDEENVDPFLVRCKMTDSPPTGCEIVPNDNSTQTRAVLDRNGKSARHCTLNKDKTEYECCEIFKSCWHLQRNYRLVKGQHKPVNSYYVIDSDGPTRKKADGKVLGKLAPFRVFCRFPFTVVPPQGRNRIKINTPANTTKFGPQSVCKNIRYKGASLKQLDALTKVSKFCQQDAKYIGKLAPFTKMANWFNSKRKEQKGWAGAMDQPECACGTQDMCEGGPDVACNNDAKTGAELKDHGTFVNKYHLPVFKVCLGFENRTDMPLRYAKSEVKGLICGPRPFGIKKNCQDYRNARKVASEVYLTVPNRKAGIFPTYCNMTKNPPLGVDVITHTEFENCVEIPKEGGDVEIKYHIKNKAQLIALTAGAEYCTQTLMYNCNKTDLNLTGTQWYSINGDAMKYWAGNTDGKGCLGGKCKCNSLGNNLQDGGLLTDKTVLPVKKLTFAPETNGGSRCFRLGPLKCYNVYRNCEDIRKNKAAANPNRDGSYAVDPDLVDKKDGGVEPFAVKCKKVKGVGLISVVPHADQKKKKFGSDLAPASKKITLKYYNGATIEQIQALIQSSKFCKQKLIYRCNNLPLLNNFNPTYSYFTYDDTASKLVRIPLSDVSKVSEAKSSLLTSSSLSEKALFSEKASAVSLADKYASADISKKFRSWAGADAYDDVVGCACAVLGTCPKDSTCRCDTYVDADKELTEGGDVTNKAKLPIKELLFGGTKNRNDSSGSVQVGPILCGRRAWGYPRHCQHAKNKFGLKVSGEIQIQPNNKVNPFVVYCDLDTKPGTAITVIPGKTGKKVKIPVKGSVSISYKGADLEQIRALVQASKRCYMPVRLDCFATQFLGISRDNYYKDQQDKEFRYWGHGNRNNRKCRCGQDKKCGGNDAKDVLQKRACNCDVGDNVWRADAGIMSIKNTMPMKSLNFDLGSNPNASAFFTHGDLSCSQSKINYNECSLGYSDCHKWADCVNKKNSYGCRCRKGYRGKNRKGLIANGRECHDDNECRSKPCPNTAKCVNTVGSFRCKCKKGFRQTGPRSCKDINECAEGTHDCDINAKCKNKFGSYKCICKEGFRGSGRVGKCESVGICKCFGDPHCRSYDQKLFHFQGSCKYLMTRDGCVNGIPSGKPNFEIVQKYWKDFKETKKDVSWVKEVYVYVYGHEFLLKQGKKVLHNGVRITGLPTKPIADHQDLRVRNVGRNVVISWGTKATGIKEVKWSGTTSNTVIIPTSYQNQMCGMCGNYNNIKKDDMMIGQGCPNDTAGAVTKNLNKFGTSWIYKPDKEDGKDCKRDCDAPPPPTCSGEDRTLAEQECAVLKDTSENGRFKACVENMTAEALNDIIESCVFDLCNVERERGVMLCQSAEALVNYCQQEIGVEMKPWRSAAFCPLTCGKNMVFNPCGKSCQKSCVSSAKESTLLSTKESTVLNTKESTLLSAKESTVLNTKEDAVSSLNEAAYSKEAVLREAALKEEATITKVREEALEEAVDCDGPCVETCECMEGMVLDREDQCVKKEECGCEEKGQYYPVGTVEMRNNCTLECGCKSPMSSVVCSPVTCDKAATCGNVDGDVNCYCNKGYRGDGRKCTEIDECNEDPKPCHEDATCENLPGTYKCTCNKGYQGNGEKCIDINECTNGTHKCGPNTKCRNREGSYRCPCLKGYERVPGTKECKDIDECADSKDNCDRVSTNCVNEPGTFKCQCKKGYKAADSEAKSYRICYDIDECEKDNNECSKDAICFNSKGSYSCTCKKGYKGTADGKVCDDVNECEILVLNDCDRNAACTNTNGSYSCACKQGYEDKGEGKLCEALDPSVCDRDCDAELGPNSECEVEGTRVYTCKCNRGYKEVTVEGKRTCENVNECESNPCSVDAKCEDNEGSFTCSCKKGFTSKNRGFTCDDIDECSTNHECSQYAKCKNTEGSYVCECLENYEGDGKICKDKDECEQGTYKCAEDSHCVNTNGGYICECDNGYSGHCDACEDINECDSDLNDCHGFAKCTNLNGTYECDCNKGYEGDGRSCSNINECLKGTHDCETENHCVDTLGSFECQCDIGYKTNEKNACEDVNECSTSLNLCSPNAKCINTEGSYKCLCAAEYTGDGIKCTLDGPNSCGDEKCDSNAVCELTAEGKKKCQCIPGYQGDGTSSLLGVPGCASIDVCKNTECDGNAMCIPLYDVGVCVCREGYLGNGNECRKPEPCDDADRCGPLATCVNTGNGAYVCQCPELFVTVDNKYCKDEDECETGKAKCPEKVSFCVNQPLGYSCNCANGYELNEDEACVDIDECTKGLDDCSEDASCTNTEGDYECTCLEPTGEGDGTICYEGGDPSCSRKCGELEFCSKESDGSEVCNCVSGAQENAESKTCENINECKGANKCHEKATCTDKFPGYSCECNKGYTGNGVKCEDTEECATGEDDCASNADCTNTEGGYYCVCRKGYKDISGGDGMLCEPYPSEDDICKCGPNGVCDSVSGLCKCNEAFVADYTRKNQKCWDKDECAEGGHCHKMAVCQNTFGGFTCSCPLGFDGDGYNFCDPNECTQNTDTCDENAICVDTLGHYKCFCEHGYTGDGFTCDKLTDPCDELEEPCAENAYCRVIDDKARCDCKAGYSGEDCDDINECKEEGPLKHDCDKNAKCINTDGGFFCVCEPGYRGVTGKVCTDVNECIPSEGSGVGTGPCPAQGNCVNSEGSFSCKCKEGLEIGNGTFCKPIPACGGECEEKATCQSTEYGGHVCVCDEGYEMKEGRCKDINECVAKETCGKDAVCDNQEPGFECTCRPGFVKDGKTCHDINECLDNKDNSCVDDNIECVNIPGSYECKCEDGYTEIEGQCQDIDECKVPEDTSCSENADCVNLPGTYGCQCKKGFYGDGDDCIECPREGCAECELGYIFNGEGCVELNKCKVPKNSIFFHECVNSECEKKDNGAYICDCEAGFEPHPTDITKCIDKDECSKEAKVDVCGPNGKCHNTKGSYECLCEQGYQVTDEGCMDVNECLDRQACGGKNAAVCTNKEGSFECVCKPGYRETKDGKCEDKDECVENVDICGSGDALCINQPGSYKCICPTGLRMGRNGKCRDINECTSRRHPCHRNAQCENTYGSFECTCNSGFTGDGKYCNPICSPGVCPDRKTCIVTGDVITGQSPSCHCRCESSECKQEGPVCASNRQTFDSDAALLMYACNSGREIYKVHRGECKPAATCEDTKCSPFKKCVSDEQGFPKCVCEPCTEEEWSSGEVCTVKGDLYSNLCFLRVEQCAIDGDDAPIPKDGPLSKEQHCRIDCVPSDWSDWTSCSTTCGTGEMIRKRDIITPAKNGGQSCGPLKESRNCYNPMCSNSVCETLNCEGPSRIAQVCVQYTEAIAQCECKNCDNYAREPVCGMVGSRQITAPNFCMLQSEACAANKDYTFLHYGKCQEDSPNSPVNCTSVNHYERYTDPKTKCTTKEAVEVNKCSGGCGKKLGHCCLPKKYQYSRHVFICENGERQIGLVPRVSECRCEDTAALEKQQLLLSESEKQSLVQSIEKLQPVLSSETEKQSLVQSSEKLQPVLSSETEKQSLVQSSEKLQPVLSSETEKQSLVQSSEKLQPVLSSETEKQSLVQSSEKLQPVLSSETEKQSLVQSSEKLQPVLSSETEKQSLVQSSEKLQPVLSSDTEKQSLVQSSEELQPVLSSETEKQSLVQSSEELQPVLSSETEKQSLVQSSEKLQPVLSSETEKQSLVQSSEELQPVLSSETEKQSLVQSSEELQPVLSSETEKQSLVQSSEELQPVLSSETEKQSLVQSSEELQPVLSSETEKQSLVQSSEELQPVLSSETETEPGTIK